MAQIDPTAIVSSDANLAGDVVVGPYAVIGSGVTIGAGSVVGPFMRIDGPATIGERNHFVGQASIGTAPQDLKYKGERTALVIGSDNTFREFVTVNRGTAGGGGTTHIGSHNFFMAYSHVAHDCTVGSRTIFANGATLAGHVEVGDDATVGAYSGVHQFCRVARFAFVGGYSVVTQDALPWVLTVGNRATSHGVNIVGLKRRGYPPEVVEGIKKCYMTLFRSRLLLDEAVARVESELGHLEEIRYFLEFVRTSKRGVIR